MVVSKGFRASIRVHYFLAGSRAISHESLRWELAAMAVDIYIEKGE